jgi:hypothetical protein
MLVSAHREVAEKRRVKGEDVKPGNGDGNDSKAADSL